MRCRAGAGSGPVTPSRSMSRPAPATASRAPAGRSARAAPIARRSSSRTTVTGHARGGRGRDLAPANGSCDYRGELDERSDVRERGPTPPCARHPDDDFTSRGDDTRADAREAPRDRAVVRRRRARPRRRAARAGRCAAASRRRGQRATWGAASGKIPDARPGPARARATAMRWRVARASGCRRSFRARVATTSAPRSAGGRDGARAHPPAPARRPPSDWWSASSYCTVGSAPPVPSCTPPV